MEYIEGGPESATMEFDVKDVSEVSLTKSKYLWPLFVSFF